MGAFFFFPTKMKVRSTARLLLLLGFIFTLIFIVGYSRFEGDSSFPSHEPVEDNSEEQLFEDNIVHTKEHSKMHGCKFYTLCFL